ncbi:MAG: hypothetical protein FD174_3344 [Geobacteraceae bacterium]|nr:MAG: hypothetical protein FD174_3344 [Geobacteraceae bacterium]
MTRLTLHILLVAAWGALVSVSSVCAVETSSLKGNVVDIEGKPVDGAEIFIYDSANTKRPADFISPKSDKDGRVLIALPTGKYWAVARVRKDERYGPLMPGDKHSGEPVEIELTTDQVLENDFVVADIREVGKKKRTMRDDCLTLRGRVVDTNGVPVQNAYVFAHRNKEVVQLPDFMSAWTDEDGTYTLYLPPGEKYFVGGASTFPPEPKLLVSKELIPEADKLDIALDIELTLQ